MRVVGVKRALQCLTKSCSRRLIGPALSFFSNSDQLLTDVGLWSCGRRTASSKRSGKSTGFCRPPTRWWPERVFRSRLPHYNDGIVPCVAIRGSSPFIDCGFDARRTSHPVAVPRTAGTTIPHSRGHRAREGGSTLYFGISQPLFVTVRPPGSNGADQALVELAIMLPVLPNASACRHDRTRGDLTVAEVSREGDEQFAGERDDALP